MKATDHVKLGAALHKGLQRKPGALSSLSTEAQASGFNREITEVWIMFCLSPWYEPEALKEMYGSKQQALKRGNTA